MKKIFYLTFFVILSSCAKNPTDISSNLWFSVSKILSSTQEIPCESCLIVETSDFKVFRVSWTDIEDPMVDEPCRGAGTAQYRAIGTVVEPVEGQGQVEWVLERYDSQDTTCLPRQLPLNWVKVGPDNYELDFFIQGVYRMGKN